VEPIQDYLHALAAKLVRDAPLSAEKVRCAWEMAVGAGLARVSQAQAEADGTLRITVDDLRWKREIAKGQALILQRVQAAHGPTVAKRLVVTPRTGGATPRMRPSSKR
jgi:predicted nucleic acid-binding Zn ribbon protein